MRSFFRLWPSGVLVAAVVVGAIFVSSNTGLLGRGAGEDVPEDESLYVVHEAALILAILADDEDIAPVRGISRKGAGNFNTSEQSSDVTIEASPIPTTIGQKPPVAKANARKKRAKQSRQKSKRKDLKKKSEQRTPLSTPQATAQTNLTSTPLATASTTSSPPPVALSPRGTVPATAPTTVATAAPTRASTTPLPTPRLTIPPAVTSIPPTPPMPAVPTGTAGGGATVVPNSALISGSLIGGATSNRIVTSPTPFSVALTAAATSPGTASVDASTGTLRIRASDSPSTIRVEVITQGAGLVQARFIRVSSSTDGLLGLFGRASVSRVEFNGGISNDSFSAAGVDLPVTALGNDGDDSLIGGSVGNTIDGGNGHDVIQAVGPGSFYGQFGNDQITTGDGVDYIDGGDDNDTINAGGGADEVDGGAGNDSIDGGAGVDILQGFTGMDDLRGGLDNDTLDGGPGMDRLNGGPGNDTLRGGDDRDVIHGESGADTIEGGNGDDLILGGSDNDVISGAAGIDTIDGESGDDRISGGTEDDIIQGGMGLDTIEGGDGADTLRGGTEADVVRGRNGNDTIFGDDGDDKLFGDTGFDTIDGGRGSDVVNGGSGTDTLTGGDDDDWIVAIDDENLDSLRGGNGRDNFWRDIGATNSDIVLDVGASDADHGVRQFINPGADRTLNGDVIPGPAAPADLAIASFANNPLFPAAGPSGTDINQGQVSDCKVVSGLSALARNHRAGTNWAIRRAMVDFGDGTYGLHLGSNFYRVDAQLPLKRDDPSVPHYANLGPEGAIWVSIAEKGIALASPRIPGSPRYEDLSSTGADAVFTLFGSSQVGTPLLQTYALYTSLEEDLIQRFTGPNPQYLTISLIDSAGGGLGRRYVTDHAYTVWDMTFDVTGRPENLILRNPWGTDLGNFQRLYSDDNPNDGLIVLPVAALFNSRTGRLNWGTRVP
jgi:Ca2+-binding RTX toxin-like protein